MKNYSEIAERQADHVIAEAASGRRRLLLALTIENEEFAEFMESQCWACMVHENFAFIREPMLDHCESALIRQYDEETESQKDAYAKGER